VIVEPMVWWIWVGGLIVAVGGLLASLPKRRRRVVVRKQDRSLVEAA
jgi:cytochrome c biogenesis factor